MVMVVCQCWCWCIGGATGGRRGVDGGVVLVSVLMAAVWCSCWCVGGSDGVVLMLM